MLAFNEIRRRKVQFALVTAIVVLTAYLVLMVTGLGLGLLDRSGTALRALDGDYIAYADRADYSVIRSQLSDAHVEAISTQSGVTAAAPIGYIASILEYAPGESESGALLGYEPGSIAEPEVVEGRLPAPDSTDELLADRAWTSATGTALGDRLVAQVGLDTWEFTVVGVIDEGYFAFQPAMYLPRATWQAVASPDAPEGEAPAASIVLLQGEGLDGRSGEGWTIIDKDTAFWNIEGVREQQSTVDAMRYMGLLIGAVVIGVFFYVITMQKGAQLGVLKAIGASGVYLATQGMLQVLVISAAGALIATALALLTKATLLSGSSVPIVFSTSAVVSTAIAVIVAGLIGAALSIRQIGSVDPIIAMQQQA